MAKFQPGKSGNPHGRPPKGTAITDMLREKLPAEEFTDILVALARKGDKDIIKHIYDRFEGRVVDTHGFVDDDGNIQKIEFIITNYTKDNGSSPT